MKQDFTIRSGQVTIAGAVYSTNPSQVAPAVIVSHEFGLSMRSTARYARRLCKAGRHVFVFDYPGSGVGKSQGRSSTQMSVMTEKEDLGAVLAYVRTQAYVDPRHVSLVGASQGGLVSALLAAELGEQIEKLALLYPALNIPDDARRGSMLGRRIDPLHVPETFRVLGYVKLGPRFVRDAATLDPWEEISRFRGPVLICHGRRDRIVDVRYARQAADHYHDATLVELPRAHHLFVMPWTVRKVTALVEGFLRG